MFIGNYCNSSTN